MLIKIDASGKYFQENEWGNISGILRMEYPYFTLIQHFIPVKLKFE